ncbi:hypothetical protein QJQ45_018356 [Haematococcus lacustris]|nr:hypothetical protein QJQ45_018356 [Haematococcus lacustris]
MRAVGCFQEGRGQWGGGAGHGARVEAWAWAAQPPVCLGQLEGLEGEDENERECVAAARRVFQLSLTASSLALDLQRLELACAFLLTDRLWAVAMADLAQLAVGLHANTAQRRLLTTPSALYSPRPASLTPTASGPTAMGGQQGPGWVEKLEPFWQLLVTYVVEATAGTEHNLAWWMAAVKASNAYLPDLVTPLQRAQPMNAKMLVVAAAQYVQEVNGAAVRQQGEGGWEVLLAMAGRMRKRFRSTAAKIPKPRVAAVVSSLMQALVAAREARCLRLHQQLGAACNVTSQGNGMTAAEQVSPQQAAGPSAINNNSARGPQQLRTAIPAPRRPAPPLAAAAQPCLTPPSLALPLPSLLKLAPPPPSPAPPQPDVEELGEDKNKRECVAAARRVFQLSLTASSLALALQRLELACAFLLTDRLWAVAMADLAQLAVGLHANTAQNRLLMAPSALYSPRPASLTPTASGPTAMGGQQGPGWVEKLEPFWQLFVTYVVEATAGTEHNLAWWMAAVKAGNAYLPNLVTPLQRAQPMNAKMLVEAAAQSVQEVRQQGEGGWEVLLAMAGRMRKRFRSTVAKINNSRIAAVVSSLMQALVAAGEARCLRLHQQLGAACNVTSQGNGVTAAETPPLGAATTSSPAAAAAAEPAQGASGSTTTTHHMTTSAHPASM